MGLSKPKAALKSKRIPRLYINISQILIDEINELKAMAADKGMRFTVTDDIREFVERDVEKGFKELQEWERLNAKA